MDWGVFIGTMALIVAIFFFVVAPPWIKKWLNRIQVLIEDVHAVRMVVSDTDWVSDVLAKTITKGAYLTDEKGEKVPAPVAGVVQQWIYNSIDYGVANYGELAFNAVGEYVPQLIASAFSSDVAKENAARSAASRGASKLGGGLRGLQALQHGMRRLGGEKLGILGELLQAAPEFVKVYREAKDSGLIDDIRRRVGGADGRPPTPEHATGPYAHLEG